MNKKIVSKIINTCLGYKKGEDFLIVSDDKLEDLARKFYKITKSLNIDPTFIQMPTRKMHGQEPPRAVANALKKVDIAILFTYMSLSHTKARKDACHKFGTRIASLPTVTGEILKRSIPINYTLLNKKVERLANILTKGKTLTLYTKRGTHLTMNIEGREGFVDDGLLTAKGDFGNLPAGEVCVAPLEGTTNGRLVIDGSAPFIGRIKKPVEIIIKDGYAKNIPFSKLIPLMKSLGKCSRNIAEIGVGLNPNAKVTGTILEDEKAINTAHVALGNNKSFGGKVYCPCHLDFVFFKPTVLIDGVKIKIT